MLAILYQLEGQNWRGGITYKTDKGSDGIGIMNFDTAVNGDGYLRKKLSEAAQQLLERYSSQLNLNYDQLRLSERHIIEIRKDLVSVNFDRFLRDYRVRDAYVEVVFGQGKDGLFRCLKIVNRSLGPIEIVNEGVDFLDVSVWLADYPQLSLEGVERIILPVVLDGRYRFYQATSMTAHEGREGITVTAADGNGEILEAYSHRHDVSRILGNSFSNSYLDGQTTASPLRLVNVTISGEEFSTDIDGFLSEPVSGNAEVVLSSSRVAVGDTLTEDLVRFQVELQEGSVLLGENADDIKAINTYQSVFRINQFVRRSLDPEKISFLDNPANVVINVAGSCNAFYDTRFNSLNFFLEGDGCADTALLNDVIYHEWGHGLDFFTGRQGGITDGAFSEGIGDILATYITGESELAKGFFLANDNGIRNVANTNRYPEDQGAVHFEGQIIGGAFWDLKNLMEERYGARRGQQKAMDLFFEHLLTTDAYLDSYEALLTLDDDDNNPATRSPNFCLINQAFANHGLAESEGCDDQALPSKPDVDEDVTVAVLDEDQLLLVASAKDVDRVQGCFGDIYDCLESESKSLELSLEGESVTGRRIFQAELPQRENSHSFLTVFLVVGGKETYQSFKLSPK